MAIGSTINYFKLRTCVNPRLYQFFLVDDILTGKVLNRHETLVKITLGLLWGVLQRVGQAAQEGTVVRADKLPSPPKESDYCFVWKSLKPLKVGAPAFERSTFNL